MKRLLLLTLLISTPAHAKTQAETCKEVEENAQATMTLRQWQVKSMAEQMERANSLFTADDIVGIATKQLIIDAYSLPVYETPEMQQIAITEFANQAMVQCYKTTPKE